VLDLLLLGLGNDAHILSLHPGCSEITRPTGLVVALRHPPMTPALDRITFTPLVLDEARQVLVIVPGASRSAAVAAMVDPSQDPVHVPARLIARACGRVDIPCDAAAASRLVP